MDGSDLLSIGALSARAGIAASALRFYDREGLVPSVRSPGGQRRYPRSALRRVAFIRAAQNAGLSLDEIRDALATLPQGRTPTAEDWARLSASRRPPGRAVERPADRPRSGPHRIGHPAAPPRWSAAWSRCPPSRASSAAGAGRVADVRRERPGIGHHARETSVDRLLDRLSPIAIGALAVLILIAGWLLGLSG